MANNHATLTDLFTDIANAIRSKRGVSDSMVADNFPAEILAIPEGSGSVLESVTVTPTGKAFTVTPDDGVDGFDSVKVNGDDNLTPENIAEGITIYGVKGALKGGGGSGVEFSSNAGRAPGYGIYAVSGLILHETMFKSSAEQGEA